MHDEEDAIATSDFKEHHVIAEDESNAIVYGDWISAHSLDQAFEVSLSRTSHNVH